MAQPLSRERILEAALEIVDREGLAALSMRRLGDALGVEAMSLYNHVPNKAALHDGVYEQILESVAPAPKKATWKEHALHQGRALRDALARHPRAIPLFASRPATTHASLARLEGQLRVLRAAGLAPLEALHTIQIVVAFVVGHAMWSFGRPGDDTAPPPYEGLDPHAFPHVREVAKALVRYDPAQEFAIGLEALVDGLARAHKKRAKD